MNGCHRYGVDQTSRTCRVRSRQPRIESTSPIPRTGFFAAISNKVEAAIENLTIKTTEGTLTTTRHLASPKRVSGSMLIGGFPRDCGACLAALGQGEDAYCLNATVPAGPVGHRPDGSPGGDAALAVYGSSRSPFPDRHGFDGASRAGELVLVGSMPSVGPVADGGFVVIGG